MNFKPTWYKGPFVDIPSFQDLDSITGMAFDENGTYIGPKEKSDMQLVVDGTTGRQYFANKDLNEDNLKYAIAKFDKLYSPEEWWGMMNDPMLNTFEKVSVSGVEGVKSALKVLATTPTKLVSGAVGVLDMVGREVGFIPAYLQDDVNEMDNLYRASAKNWETTLDKWGLAPVSENIRANSVLVNIGQIGGEVAGSLLTAAAFSSVGGLPAVASIFGAQQYQQIREEYLQKGFSLDQANRYAFIAGMAEGGIEAVGFKYLKRYATMNRSINNLILSAAAEAGQESFQTISEAAITNWTGLRSDTLKSILLDVTISALAGGIVGTGASVVSSQSEQRIEKIIETTDLAVSEYKDLPKKQEIAQTVEMEMEFAKKNKNNKLYNIVNVIAKENKIDDKGIAAIYKTSKLLLEDGTTQHKLLEAIGNQIVSYKSDLEQGGLKGNHRINEAIDIIRYSISEESVRDFRDKAKETLGELGVGDNFNTAVSEQVAGIYKTLSNSIGVDINTIKAVDFNVIKPKRQDTKNGKSDFKNKYKPMREVFKRIKQIEKEQAALEKEGKRPRSTLLSILRRKGVDYSKTEFDLGLLKDMQIPNRKQSMGAMGANFIDFLRKHNFLTQKQVSNTYDNLIETMQSGEKLILSSLNGESVYSLEKNVALNKAELYSVAQELEQEKQDLLADATKGQINFTDSMNNILLGKFADATTLLHELMHHFENVIDIAAAQGNITAKRLSATKDKIIADNWKDTSQDVNRRLEVISEAYEAWLWHGAKSSNSREQSLLNVIRDYMRNVYESVKAITGIRIDEDIDGFFREITGVEQTLNQIHNGYDLFKANPQMVKQVEEDISKYKSGLMPKGKSIFLGKPNAFLLKLGVPNYTFKLKQKTITKDTKTKHFVKIDTFKNLPTLLADPILVLKSDTQKGSFVFVLNDLDVKNNRVIAAVDPDGSVEFNNIDSVYGKDNKYWVKKQIEKGNLLYIDESKALKESSHLYLRGVPYKASVNNILTKGGIVKEQSANNTLYQTVRAQKVGAKVADEKPSKEQISKDLEIIRNNGIVKFEPKRAFGLTNFTMDLLITVRQRAGAIDPKLKVFFDKLDFFGANIEKSMADKANPFLKKYKALSERDKNEFDYYVYHQLSAELETFVKSKGLLKEYKQVRDLLNFIYQIGNQSGIDMGFIHEYFPTAINNYSGFLDSLKGTNKWTYIDKALHELDPKRVLSEKERADTVNKILRGYHKTDPVGKPSGAKERKILYKSPELMRFYEHSDIALIKYLTGMAQAIAINKAFGKGAGFDTEETIGAVVLGLIENGTITRAEESEIKALLKSRLNYANSPAFISIVKNIGYLQTMNNFTSAITQLGDLYAPFYKYGFKTAMQAMFGKKELTPQDLGLNNVWEEFSDKTRTGVAVDKLFKLIGLKALDSFGKTKNINASFANLRVQAESGDIALTERLAHAFGGRANTVLQDILNRNLTIDIKLLVWSDLADTQPIGRSGVPKLYLDNPSGRLFYQLKTYTTNQISLYYADCILNINRGVKIRDKDMFLKGVQNTFKLLILLTAFNATADVLKNIIMGREIDISDVLVSNMLWNIGLSKYAFYKGERDGYLRAIAGSMFTPPQLSIADDIYLDVKRISTGRKKAKDTCLVNFLPFGRAYYWWFGGGRTNERKKHKKPFRIRW